MNCTDGPATIQTDLVGRFFLCFPILSRVRKLGGKIDIILQIYELLKRKG